MKRIIFAGAGHANIVALRRLGRRRIGAELVLVNDGPQAWYTGALPALIRGDITSSQAAIDLPALAAHCGARFIDARVAGFSDHALRLAAADPLDFDFLAIAIGGKTIADGVKPIPDLLRRLEALRPLASPGLGILGSGAAGVEIALAARQRLGPSAEICLCGKTLLPRAPARARRIALRYLATARIELVSELPARHDALIRAYTPEPDMAVRQTLQLFGEDHVFAAGDCAKFPSPVARSGAIAVRQGRVLAANLRASVRAAPLQAFKPPPATLAIMRLDGSRALAWYGGTTVHGVLPSRLKAWLDRRWLKG